MYYGTGTGCCSGQYSQMPYYPYYGNSNSYTYAIILVLFILLVIVIGCRWTV